MCTIVPKYTQHPQLPHIAYRFSLHNPLLTHPLTHSPPRSHPTTPNPRTTHNSHHKTNKLYKYNYDTNASTKSNGYKVNGGCIGNERCKRESAAITNSSTNKFFFKRMIFQFLYVLNLSPKDQCTQSEQAHLAVIFSSY